MTYHFYLSVGKFPKLFNFSDGKEKSYLVELNIFKENAFYGLQKILLDNFPPKLLYLNCHREWYVHAKNQDRVTELNFELKANVSRRFYYRFTRFYAAFNFR